MSKAEFHEGLRVWLVVVIFMALLFALVLWLHRGQEPCEDRGGVWLSKERECVQGA